MISNLISINFFKKIYGWVENLEKNDFAWKW